LSFKIAADYEIMLRFLEKFNLPYHYIPETLVVMRAGGASNSNVVSIIKGNLECYKALKTHGINLHSHKNFNFTHDESI